MSTMEIKVVSTVKLANNRSNWVTYHEKLVQKLKAAGVGHHLCGTVPTPPFVVSHTGKWYSSADMVFAKPLSDNKSEKLDIAFDNWETKEAKIRTIIYESISNAAFNAIKSTSTANGVWVALKKYMNKRGDMTQQLLLTQLNDLQCPDKSGVKTYITEAENMQQRLAGMGMDIAKDQLTIIILKGLSPSFNSTCQTLNAASKILVRRLLSRPSSPSSWRTTTPRLPVKTPATMLQWLPMAALAVHPPAGLPCPRVQCTPTASAVGTLPRIVGRRAADVKGNSLRRKRRTRTRTRTRPL